jgi:hypothetical protein
LTLDEGAELVELLPQAAVTTTSTSSRDRMTVNRRIIEMSPSCLKCKV